MEAPKDVAPLHRMVLCCTSIDPETRHALASAAVEMGAVHKLDLTADVTHIIVGNVDTPKYKYVAKERPDVKAMLPSFVHAVRDAWIAGGDVIVAELEKEHRCPPFFGLKICTTGFDQMGSRAALTKGLESNGAIVHADLTRAVTHLIAATASGKKYTYARNWGLKIVGYEWVQDTLERGMVLDEALYDVVLAPQDRGKNAWNKRAVEAVKLGKRQREEEKQPEPAARRKMRRTMSTKLESQQDSIWADIASAGSGQQKQAQQDDWQAPEVDSVLGLLPRNDGHTDDTPDPTIEPSRRASAAAQQPRPRSLGSGPKTTFQNVYVYMHGFDSQKVDILRHHLETHGARTCHKPAMLDEEDMDPMNTFVLVPSDIPADRLPRLPTKVAGYEQVTEMWVLNCVSKKTLLDPNTYPLCKPFAHWNIEGFNKLTICTTGFWDADLLHVSQTIPLMGAKYSAYLDLNVNILLCKGADVRQEKLDYANEEGIKAVDEEWLYKSIELGVMQSTDEFAIRQETPTVPVEYNPSKSKSGSRKSSLKGRLPAIEFKTLSKKPVMDPKARVTKPAQTKPKRVPFFTEDDDQDDEPLPELPDLLQKPEDKGKRPPSQPLRELSQEQQNSQASQPSQDKVHGKKRIMSAANENFDASSAANHLLDAAAAGVSQDDSQKESQKLDNRIAQLLAAKRSNSDVSESKAEQAFGKRKRGSLGRAISGSLGSMRQSSVGSNISQDDGQRPAHVAEKEAVPLPDPSQKIIYQDERTEEERRKLIEGLGGNFVEGSSQVGRKTVQSIGTVKDASPTNVGGRGRRRGAGLGKRE